MNVKKAKSREGIFSSAEEARNYQPSHYYMIKEVIN